MSAQITYYYASVSSSMEIKKQQQKMEMILEAKKDIELVKVDITANSEDRDRMRELCGNDKALPPQIANGDVYCGDFIAFDEAVEIEKLNEFLKID